MQLTKTQTTERSDNWEMRGIKKAQLLPRDHDEVTLGSLALLDDRIRDFLSLRCRRVSFFEWFPYTLVNRPLQRSISVNLLLTYDR